MAVKSQNTSDDMAALKEVYNTLLKRKQDISKEIHTLKYKGKMFPPIGRLPLPKSSPLTPTVVSFSDVIEEEEEESWMTDGDEEQQYYDMEFNMEPKTSSRRSSDRRQPLSSLSSSRGTVGSFERANDREDVWENPYDGTQNDLSDDGDGHGVVAVSDETVKVDDILEQMDRNGDEVTDSG